MPSVFGRNLAPSERRTITAGAVVVGAAALIVLVIVPFVRRWNEREALISATRERLARVESIVGLESQLAEATRKVDARLNEQGVRLVRAPSQSLAAAAVQSMIRDYARASVITVTRLDAAGTPIASGSGLALPATIAAQGDIYGIADFLRQLQHGPTMLELTDFAIAPNPVLRGNIIQVTIGLRAPLALEP